MADELKTKKISELPLAPDFGDGDTLLGLQDGVTKRTAASLIAEYVLAKQQTVNVKDYGAKGDGVTNDLAAVQALINSVASTNGGAVFFPRGNYLITGLKVPCNVVLVGAGAGATFLSYAGESGLIGVEFTYRATSYNLAGAYGLTFYNTGSFGLAAVKTPVLTDVFTRTQRYAFSDFAVRGVSANASHMAIGDCGSGSAQRFFIQGPYIAQNTDTGQPTDVGILLKGERGVVNFEISAYKMRGVRTGLQVSDFAEGFSIHDGEMVGSWDGITLDSNPSKPGGFIYANHLNCNHRGISATRRRDITIGDNQYYRDGSYFEHGLGWVGCEGLSSGKMNIGLVQVRVGVATPPFTSEHIGVSLVDTPNTSIKGVLSSETGTLQKGVKLSASVANLCGGVSVDKIQGDALTNWVHLDGPVNDFKLADNVTEVGAASAIPILVTGTGLDKASIKLPKTSTAVPEYLPLANRTAAFSRDVRCRAVPPLIKESLVAGTGAYAVNYYFSTTDAMHGDRFEFKLVQIGGSNSTLNLYSGASSGSPALLTTLAAAAAGTNQYRLYTLIFNGTAWEILAPLVTTA